jgi:hypothetical protein
VKSHTERTFPQISGRAKDFTSTEKSQVLLETEQYVGKRLWCYRSLIDAFTGGGKA